MTGKEGLDAWKESGLIARLALPLALAQFGVTAIGLVDVAILGHASAVDLGGASIGRSISFACGALGIGVSGALEPLAAQAIGAGDRDAAWRALVAALFGCLLISVPCAVAAWASTSMLDAIGVEFDLIAPARRFLLPQLPAMLGFSVFLCVKSFLLAHHRTTPSFVAAALANVVNVVVCNLLVRGDDALRAVGLPPAGLPALGAFGAGIASSVATWTMAVWVLGSAWRMRPTGGPAVVLRQAPIGKVLRIGAPIGLQLLAEIGVFSLAAVLAGRLGRVAVSAHQIAIGLASFTFMGALGIGGATAVRVGHAIGEDRSPRAAGLVGIALGAGFMSTCGLVFLALQRPLVAAFTSDADVIEMGAGLLVIAAAFQLFDGVQGVAAGALRGAADVRFAFVVNVLAHWLIGLPLALWLAFPGGLGARGLWIGLLVGLVLVAVLLLVRFMAVARGPLARV